MALAESHAALEAEVERLRAEVERLDARCTDLEDALYEAIVAPWLSYSDEQVGRVKQRLMQVFSGATEKG
jgi:hypothetical protein